MPLGPGRGLTWRERTISHRYFLCTKRDSILILRKHYEANPLPLSHYAYGETEAQKRDMLAWSCMRS